MAHQYGAPSSYNNQWIPQGAAGSPGGYGHHSRPSHMPDFSSPVIRMGNDGFGGPHDGRGSRYDNRGRAGLGADQRDGRTNERDRDRMRDTTTTVQPATKEEIARTIFVGNLGENAPPDEALEAILRSAGRLRRWTRARDANDKKCRFGFAEYEDVDSLEAAKEIFGTGIEVPAYKNGKLDKGEGDSKPRMMKLLVVIDEQSSAYIDEWMSKRKESDNAKAFRLEGAKDDLRHRITRLSNATAHAANAFDPDGDATMHDGANGTGPDAAPAFDDELADIPPEMRATVAQEIKNFRDRSNRRDLDQARLEAEAEAASRVTRVASPPPSIAPSGPANGARGVTGAPSGPKGYRGVQLPSDYVNGVTFVNGNLPPEDESDASDTELENRRKAIRAADDERAYNDAERRWLNRERQRLAAQERERVREAAETRDRERQAEIAAKKYSEWDDDDIEKSGREEYYYDRTAWARRRATQRDREAREDDRDRRHEQQEQEAQRLREDESRGAADRFLAETGAELAAKQPESSGPAFKISLGGGARNRTARQPAVVETAANLLEDEEDAAETHHQRRALQALPSVDNNATSNIGSEMTDAERTAARKALAADIPMESEALFAWDVRWSYVRPDLIDREIRPFVEKKIVDYLGVQEDFLVDLVIDCLKEQKPAQELVKLLATVLDEEAETLARKVWRLIVYFGEAEGRGLT